jgi:hypothetical protein
VATPILIAEGIAAERRTEPWLKVPGLVITVLLFLLGCAATTNYHLQASPFRAHPAQLLAAAVLVIVAIGAAFVFKPVTAASERTPDAPRATGDAPSAWLVGVFAFVVSAAFIVIEAMGRGHRLTPALGLSGQVACELMAIVTIAHWSGLRGWMASHYLAIAAGTSLTYALFGLYAFLLEGHTHLGVPTGAIDVAGQIVLALIIVALIVWGVRRSQRGGVLRGALA